MSNTILNSGDKSKLSDFDYKIPNKNLIAKSPVDPRNNSKMMVLDRQSGEVEDKKFDDIVSMMQRGDCIVVNESKVFPSRIFGTKEKTSDEIEVILIRKLSTENTEENLWNTLVEPARKVRGGSESGSSGNKILFDGYKFYCEVIDNTDVSERSVRLTYPEDVNIYRLMERMGQMAIPGYIDRKPEEFDKHAYQTIFANDEKIVSIAPATAGLHFTPQIVEVLEKKGVKIVKISVSIGKNIFSKIDVEDISKYSMFLEEFNISTKSAEIINKTLQTRRNVYAIGCSVARALESSVLTTGKVKPNKGMLDKFIYPPYNFKVVSRLLTNFHPAKSPSIIMASAFAGTDNIKKAYKKAIKDEYRFHAYGDAMLII